MYHNIACLVRVILGGALLSITWGRLWSIMVLPGALCRLGGTLRLLCSSHCFFVHASLFSLRHCHPVCAIGRLNRKLNDRCYSCKR